MKIDTRDAFHLARLLKPGDITGATAPSIDQEAARDLVRARKDCWADLMRSRRSISKFLLRQGMDYSREQAWTGRHETWLREQHFPKPSRQLTYRS